MPQFGPSSAECAAVGLQRQQVSFIPPDTFYFDCQPALAVTPESCPSCFATPQQARDIELARRTGQIVTSQGDKIRVGACPPGTHPSPYNVASCVRDFRDTFNPAEYFKSIGIAIAQGAALVASAGTLTPLTAAAFYGSQFVSTLQAAGALKMGIDLGGIFGGLSSAIGGLSSGNYWQALSGGLGAASSAFVPSAPAMPMYGPVYNPLPPYQAPQPSYPMQPQPVGAFSVAANAIGRLTAPILQKIAVKLGLRARPSLNRAMEMVRKAAKILTSPEAVATALGITVAELATLITTSNARKRRRMNPANSKALRRAARRIKSFHRLCTHTDVLRGRARARVSYAFAGRGRSCRTCKKNPCSC